MTFPGRCLVDTPMLCQTIASSCIHCYLSPWDEQKAKCLKAKRVGIHHDFIGVAKCHAHAQAYSHTLLGDAAAENSLVLVHGLAE